MILKTDMTTVLPPSKKGKAEVRHFVIDERMASASRIRQAATRGREQAVKEGTYAQLYVDGSLVMSDTQMEWDTNIDMMEASRGDVLIAGLGLGMILLPILRKERVKSVTVIEKSRDVIQLVEPRIREATSDAHKLTVIHADIMTWESKGTRWDTIYFDIWPTISRDNLKQIKELHRKFRPRLRPRGWLSSWLYDDLRAGYFR